MTNPQHRAFPSKNEAEEKFPSGETKKHPVGLTKREYMATAIMAGFAAADVDELPDTGDEIAELAVAWADSLIRALNQNSRPS